MEGSAHWMYIEEPARWVGHVATFLDGLAAKAPGAPPSS